jgi:hypothetical protein
MSDRKKIDATAATIIIKVLICVFDINKTYIPIKFFIISDSYIK